MKSKLFIIALIGLCLSFIRANPQTSKNTIPPKVSNVPPPGGMSCLDTYLNYTGNLWNTLTVQIASCNSTYSGNPDANIECNRVATDMYLFSHGVATGLYDQCKACEIE